MCYNWLTRKDEVLIYLEDCFLKCICFLDLYQVFVSYKEKIENILMLTDVGLENNKSIHYFLAWTSLFLEDN